MTPDPSGALNPLLSACADLCARALDGVSDDMAGRLALVTPSVVLTSGPLSAAVWLDAPDAPAHLLRRFDGADLPRALDVVLAVFTRDRLAGLAPDAAAAARAVLANGGRLAVHVEMWPAAEIVLVLCGPNPADRPHVLARAFVQEQAH